MKGPRNLLMEAILRSRFPSDQLRLCHFPANHRPITIEAMVR
jgi:hypothetical protein